MLQIHIFILNTSHSTRVTFQRPRHVWLLLQRYYWAWPLCSNCAIDMLPIVLSRVQARLVTQPKQWHSQAIGSVHVLNNTELFHARMFHNRAGSHGAVACHSELCFISVPRSCTFQAKIGHPWSFPAKQPQTRAIFLNFGKC